MLEALAHSGLGKVQDTAKSSLPLMLSASIWSCSQQEKEQIQQFRFVNCIGLHGARTRKCPAHSLPLLW